MNGRKIVKLSLLCLGVTGVCWAAEAGPDAVMPPLRYEMGTEPRSWVVRAETSTKGEVKSYSDPGPIRPTHVAEIVLNRNCRYFQFDSYRKMLESIRENLSTEHMSKAQKEFVETEFAISIDDETLRIPNHYSIWLYAVNETDANKMVEAFLDACAKEAAGTVQERKSELAEYQKKAEEAKKDLSEKEARLIVVEEEYKAAKGNRHRYSSDEDAAKLAQETMTAIDKVVDTLDIELAGIREKLKIIEKYRSEPNFSVQVRYRLDEMFVEQMVELKGVEASKQVAESIRATEQRIHNLFTERGSLRGELDNLRGLLATYQMFMDAATDKLTNPTPSMLPAKVYRNVVTIYPVRGS